MNVFQPGDQPPMIPAGTLVAVRMRGHAIAEAFEEVDGFYLNEYGLYYDDGCECFAPDERLEEYAQHSDHGCPATGFYKLVQQWPGEEGLIFVSFNATEWHLSEAQG